MSIWLGLFAMLMIHGGPLISAWQLSPSPPQPEVHRQHLQHERGGAAQSHHQAAAVEPAWLAALVLCGYCELLTLNPPLSLTPCLVLPHHGPEQFAVLPAAPWQDCLHWTTHQARAPPPLFPS